MSKQDAVFHAFEEWWALVGSKVLSDKQDAGEERGAEVDAWFAGAEWMREQCERIVRAYPADLTYSTNIVLIDAVCGIVADRIHILGGAQ